MRVLFISLFVIIVDQLTKFSVRGIRIPFLNINIEGIRTPKSVISDFFRITLIENPGMAFGLNIGPKMFLTIFTIIASIIILYYIYKHRNDGKLIRISLAFILAGAIGNLIDRTFYGLIYGYDSLFYGRVVDFIQIGNFAFTFLGRTYTSWPIFNIADVSVTVGFLLILLFHKTVFKHTEETQEATETNEIHTDKNPDNPDISSLDNLSVNSTTGDN